MSVKVGDKIRYTGPRLYDLTRGKVYKVVSFGEWGFDVLDDVGDHNGIAQSHYELVTDTPPAPTIFRDMTDAEKGALLLAKHQGKVIEAWIWSGWTWVSYQGSLGDYGAYRVAPRPVVETVTLCYRRGQSPHVKNRIGTMDLKDGKPDPDSIKMEETQ